ncbi:hypothetical protein INT45_011478 [Circinella minor]|uniref:Transmembrane protein n=1 Tax=Circinella minor TaxID=1195481 RepID=A0A8H7S0K9_9FUNG|nr:hypothetical protein INT45_011478 [Circinella minor]
MENQKDKRTLLRHCDDQNICHCDWRLTLVDCEESVAMYYINIINIILCSLAVIIGIGLITHRMVIKGHRLWDHQHGSRGCLRPKPVDCLLFMLTIYNVLRLVSSVILVVDIAPENLIVRSFMFEFPWQWGIGAFTLYLVGIAQTLADSHKKVSSGWLPSPTTVDILGSWFFLWPFIIHNICSLLAGGLAETNLKLAEIFTRLLYGFWFWHNASINMAIIFSGVRLINILKGHLAKFNSPSNNSRYHAIKMGIAKIQAIIIITNLCLLLFATLLLLYGILRDQIMTNTTGSIFLGAIWNTLGTLSTLLVELAVIINPSFEKNAALGANSSSGGNQNPSGEKSSSSSNQYTGQENGTMTFYSSQQQEQHHSYDDDGNQNTNAYYMKNMESVIADQQMEYQQVIQRHTMINATNGGGDRVKKYNITNEVKKPNILNSSPILDEYEISAFYNNKNESQENILVMDDISPMVGRR